MDIIDKVKEILSGQPKVKIAEGAPDAYDKVKSLTDKELEEYIGVDPVKVPREVQEELYQRFVQPHAHIHCNECHGRGHKGWIPQLHQLEPCLCLQRTIKTDGKKDNYLYDPSGNKIMFSN